jgi:hypothetical protein
VRCVEYSRERIAVDDKTGLVGKRVLSGLFVIVIFSCDRSFFVVGWQQPSKECGSRIPDPRKVGKAVDLSLRTASR